MNKKGKVSPMIWIVIALVVLYFAFQAGWFERAAPEEVIPSDKQTTVDLSFKDELATTETTVNAVWYLFNGDGSFFKSGTATSGLDSVTAEVLTSYDLWAYTTGESGFVAKKTSFNTGSRSRMPITVTLTKRSGFEVSDINDPIDLDQNISGTTGATEEVRILYKANVSNAGNTPIVVLETNSTSTGVEDITMTKADNAGGKYSEITCPDRLTPRATSTKLYCFERDKIIYASDGIIVSYASIKFDDTTDPGDNSFLYGKVIDKAMYLEPGYTTIAGIKFAAEDDADADVGAGDSAEDSIQFAG